MLTQPFLLMSKYLDRMLVNFVQVKIWSKLCLLNMNHISVYIVLFIMKYKFA